MKFPSCMEMDRIKDIAAKLRSHDARDWEGIKEFEITADDIKALGEFMTFYKTLFSRMYLDHWPILAREQSDRFMAYLDQFHVQYHFNEHGVDVLYHEEHGYESRSDHVAFIFDDTFKCDICGKQVQIFDKTCDDCIHDAQMRAFMPDI